MHDRKPDRKPHPSDNHIPAKLALALRESDIYKYKISSFSVFRGGKLKWKVVASKLKALGYPPDPYLPFSPRSISHAVRQYQKRKEKEKCQKMEMEMEIPKKTPSLAPPSLSQSESQKTPA